MDPDDLAFLTESAAALVGAGSWSELAASLAGRPVPRLADQAMLFQPALASVAEELVAVVRPARASAVELPARPALEAALVEQPGPRFLVLDKHTPTALRPFFDCGARALALLPLELDETAGALFLLRTSAEPFEPREQQLATLYGAQAQAALAGCAPLLDELRRCEEEHRQHLDAVPAMIWFKDRDGRVVRCNRAGARTVGLTPSEMEGCLTEQLHPGEALEYRRDDLEVMRTGQPKQGIVEPLTLASGERIWVRTDKLPYRGRAGEIRGVLVFSVDITPLKQAEEERARLLHHAEAARREAEEANRSKDEFLTTLSHELRTPLTAVVGWAQLLARGRILDETERDRALDAILRNAKAQTRLIEDILDVSRFVRGKLTLQPSPVDLGEIIRSALDALRPAAVAKGIRLELADGPCRLTADPDRLHQVVWNLLTNAIKFTPAGGTVGVRLEAEARTARIVVRDSGIGIEPALLPHVFERFRQGDSSPSRLHGGLGVGLAVVRHLVELHGGQVSAASAGAGQGASFTVELPRRTFDAAEPEEVAGERPPGPSLAGRCVLVVDDDADAREIVRALLSDVGAEVLTAGSVGEALALLDRQAPHVLVSDIGMPLRDGHELIREVRAREHGSRRRLPALALTAYAALTDGERALESGFDAHLSKPIDADRLVGEIARLSRAGE